MKPVEVYNESRRVTERLDAVSLFIGGVGDHRAACILTNLSSELLPQSISHRSRGRPTNTPALGSTIHRLSSPLIPGLTRSRISTVTRFLLPVIQTTRDRPFGTIPEFAGQGGIHGVPLGFFLRR